MNIRQCLQACWTACCEVVDETNVSSNIQLSVAAISNSDEILISNSDEILTTQQPSSKKEEGEPLIKSQLEAKKKPEKRTPELSVGMQSRLHNPTAFSVHQEDVDPDDVFTANDEAAVAYDHRLEMLTKAQEKLLGNITKAEWKGGDLQLPRLLQMIGEALDNNEGQQKLAGKLLVRARGAIQENMLGDNQTMEVLITKTTDSEEVFAEQRALLESKQRLYELDIIEVSHQADSDVSPVFSQPLSRSSVSIFSRKLSENEESIVSSSELGMENEDDSDSLGIVEDAAPSDED